MDVVQSHMFKMNVMLFSCMNINALVSARVFAGMIPTLGLQTSGNVLRRWLTSSYKEPFIKQKNVVHGRRDQVLLRIQNVDMTNRT